MSRIYFHAPHRTAEVLGTERHQFGNLCESVALAVLRPDASGRERLAPTIVSAPDWLVGALDDRAWSRSFETWMRSTSDGDFTVGGERIGHFDLALNTLVATRSPSLALIAHIHGWCELHAFCDDTDAEWLAGVVRDALAENVLRTGAGWEDVARLCDEVAGDQPGPIVTSYSVCDRFPNRRLAGYCDTDDELDADAVQRWVDLTDAEQWAAACAGLRARDWPMQISAAEQTRGFATGKSAWDLIADLRDAARSVSPS